MKLKDYYYTVLKTKDERESFAKSIKTSPEYVRIHLIPKNNLPDREPGIKMMSSISARTGGAVSISEVVEHFKNKRDKAA